MKSNNPTFVKRYGQRPHFAGRTFVKKSMTIPGQDLSPHEIIRKFRSGGTIPEHVYTDKPISTFERLDKVEKMAYLKELTTRNQKAKEAIEIQMKSIEKQMQIDKLKMDITAKVEAQQRDAIQRDAK